MRRLLSSTLIAVAAFGIAATGAIAGDDELKFKATLGGAQEVPVPGVATESSAKFKMTINEEHSEASFRLKVFDGVDVTAAHLHCGLPGIEGPIVAVLYEGSPVDVDGELAEGTLKDADIVPQPPVDDSRDLGPVNCLDRRYEDDAQDMPVSNIVSLVQSAQKGLIYVNVHTLAITGGEVRGQLLVKRD